LEIIVDGIQLLEPTDLCPGDILIYRPQKDDRISELIASATGSPYTHAAIHVGDGLIAEALAPSGVAKSDLVASLEGYVCVGVLRSQMGFGAGRRRRLLEFVDAVIANGVPFHRSGLVHFQKQSADFFSNQLEIVRANYGQHQTPEQLAAKSYFCSGFVTACYEAVGIIDETAQVAYPPTFFSPAHLYEHSTFGWLLGYLKPADKTAIPSDDPLLNLTKWSDHPDISWWR